MLKDVIINFRTISGMPHGKPDELDFMTDGYYTFDDNIGCISYEETEVTGMTGTRTSVIVMPNKVVVDRDGSITSRMVFEEGYDSEFPYRTPFGDTMLGLKTRMIKQDISERGGNVEIEYDLNIGHAMCSRNKLILDVKEIGEMSDARNYQLN